MTLARQISAHLQTESLADLVIIVLCFVTWPRALVTPWKEKGPWVARHVPFNETWLRLSRWVQTKRTTTLRCQTIKGLKWTDRIWPPTVYSKEIRPWGERGPPYTQTTSPWRTFHLKLQDKTSVTSYKAWRQSLVVTKKLYNESGKQLTALTWTGCREGIWLSITFTPCRQATFNLRKSQCC